ncbi:MAG: DUF4214 domain-containing protein, partial [Achromobacter sp.]|uniref:DUF4214 domain-containing protein n=1 Tax=Achromobacter sp. TaxID=134375 RepID=UPI001AC9D8A5
ADGLIFGIQDGGSTIYRSDDGRMNRYRRPAMMIYRRLKPTPIFGTTYVEPPANKYFKSGSTLWVQGNNDISIKTYGYDSYPDSYGQNAQFEANIIQNDIQIKNIWDNNINFNRQVNAANGTLSSYNNGYDNGAGQIFKSMNVYWRGYTNGARDYVNGMYRNGIGSAMTIGMPGNYDFTVNADSQSKYGNWHGYRNGFGISVPGVDSNSNIIFNYLRSDVDAPTIDNAYAENVTVDGFDIVIKNINDHGRSGTQKVTTCTWIDAWNTDGKWKDWSTGDGDLRIHINRSDFGGRFATYKTDIRTVDNVNNTSSVLKHIEVAVTSPIPFNGGLVVKDYDYKDKESNSVYWMKVGNQFRIYNEGYFPSSYGMYPTKNYVLFQKDCTEGFDTAARYYSDTNRHYYYGSSFNTYFGYTSSYTANIFQGNGNNYLASDHIGKGLVDGTSFLLHHCTVYETGGNQYYNGYTNSGLWFKFDGRAPSYSKAYATNDTTNGFDIVIEGVTDNNGSGVKSSSMPTLTSLNGQDDKQSNSFVNRVYLYLLGRGADSAGFNYYAGNLDNAAFTEQDVMNNIIHSSEYISKKQSNADFIKALYNIFLTREALQWEIDYWTGVIQRGDSKENLILYFYNGDEFNNSGNRTAAKLIENGKYMIHIDRMKHNGEYSNYLTHIYLRDNVGNYAIVPISANINQKPSAKFTVDSPVLANTLLNYNDLADSGDSWDSIKTDVWQWS